MTLDEIEKQTKLGYKGALAMGKDLTTFDIIDNGVTVVQWSER